MLIEESDEEEIEADVATFMDSVGNSHLDDLYERFCLALCPWFVIRAAGQSFRW